MKRVVIWLLLLSLLAFLAGVAVVLNPFKQTQSAPSESDVPSGSIAEIPEVQREVILYFGDTESSFLVQELRNIDECFSEDECVFALVRALIAGPVADTIPVLPEQALLLGVQIIEGTVRLNFNRAFISYHPGGSSSELLTIHALVNTLAANFPHIRELVLLVEGQPIETLCGHVDLRQPIGVDFSLVRQETEIPAIEVELESIETVSEPLGEQPE
ncbi:MAG: GerMN domain-containing protein [Thermodesulfobacteriota bacterium]|nr:GerMN domain-containing protein [Thermodesulfobacteriota bacterium]